jgi:hypothetical protein
MPAQSTKAWMKRNKLKAITIYVHELVFERVQAAAEKDGRSKCSWVRKLVIVTLQQRGPHDH